MNEKEWIREVLKGSGACAAGFAKAAQVDAGEWERFEAWLRRGDNAGMDYMRNYPELRRDPRGLIEGAQTIISLAFSFKPARWRETGGVIACYAYGKDYHKEIRRLLKPALRKMGERYQDARFRICVDSAPVLERYWALKAGIGVRGDNGCVIVPGYGSMVFLAEVITDLVISPDEPREGDCGKCGKCRKVCPGEALDGTVDCRRCLSYLTIEHRGEIVDEESRRVMDSEAGRNTVFGCDRCLTVCPHNLTAPPSTIGAFSPLETVMTLTKEEFDGARGDGEELRNRLAGTALLRGLRE